MDAARDWHYRYCLHDLVGEHVCLLGWQLYLCAFVVYDKTMTLKLELLLTNS